MDKQHNQSSNILKDDGVHHSVSHLLEYDLMHQDESASHAVLTGMEAAKAAHDAAIAVSYTHLTLPTILRV